MRRHPCKGMKKPACSLCLAKIGQESFHLGREAGLPGNQTGQLLDLGLPDLWNYNKNFCSLNFLWQLKLRQPCNRRHFSDLRRVNTEFQTCPRKEGRFSMLRGPTATWQWSLPECLAMTHHLSPPFLLLSFPPCIRFLLPPYQKHIVVYRFLRKRNPME